MWDVRFSAGVQVELRLDFNELIPLHQRNFTALNDEEDIRTHTNQRSRVSHGHNPTMYVLPKTLTHSYPLAS